MSIQLEIETLLEHVCSENHLDPIKNHNEQLIEIKLKNSTQEVNIRNNIPYTQRDVQEFITECVDLLTK